MNAYFTADPDSDIMSVFLAAGGSTARQGMKTMTVTTIMLDLLSYRM